MTKAVSPATISAMKQLISLIGKLLLMVAFLVTAAELAVRVQNPDLGWLPSSGAIWHIYAPDGYDAFVRVHPGIVWQVILMFPGWALFGGPGLLLVLAFYDRHAGGDSELEQSMLLYDELVKHAGDDHLKNFDPTTGDDMVPNHYDDISIPDKSYGENIHEDKPAPERDYLLGKNHKT